MRDNWKICAAGKWMSNEWINEENSKREWRILRAKLNFVHLKRSQMKGNHWYGMSSRCTIYCWMETRIFAGRSEYSETMPDIVVVIIVSLNILSIFKREIWVQTSNGCRTPVSQYVCFLLLSVHLSTLASWFSSYNNEQKLQIMNVNGFWIF